MADTTKVKIGACSVTLGSTDLGHTKGGVEVTYSPEYADITVDMYGNTIVDKALLGEALTVKVPLAESQIALLAEAMPLATATASKITLGKKAGARLLAEAQQLVLHPLVNQASDRSEDVVLYKAVVHSEVTIPYKADEERVYEVEFIALPDFTKDDGNYLGTIGDTAQ